MTTASSHNFTPHTFSIPVYSVAFRFVRVDRHHCTKSSEELHAPAYVSKEISVDVRVALARDCVLKNWRDHLWLQNVITHPAEIAPKSIPEVSLRDEPRQMTIAPVGALDRFAPDRLRR